MPVCCRSANGRHPHSYGPALEQGRLSKDMLSLINEPRCKELPEDGRKQMETFEGQPWPPAERLHCRGEIRVYVNELRTCMEIGKCHHSSSSILYN